MPHPQFDRHALRFHPLAERRNRASIERDRVSPDAQCRLLEEGIREVLAECAARIREARAAGRSRILAFGAHTIKNGLSPLLIALIERGWISHLATNGAGIIHDWEFAYCGQSSEHVAANVAEGKFGLWEETGRYLNLAIAVGAQRGLGYGEAVGRFVEDEGLDIPDRAELRTDIQHQLHAGDFGRAAATADLLELLDRCGVRAGRIDVPHPFKRFGLQAAAYRLGVPFTGHPMFGHDIIYTHPMSHGASIGRAAERDFLSFAESVSRIEGGVYLSVGSAVMSPMIFEKSFSMAQNLALQRGARIANHFIVVVDVQPSDWDWSKGEPPEHHPDYYLRFNKTFHRMGGTLRYASADNRDFLVALLHELERENVAGLRSAD